MHGEKITAKAMFELLPVRRPILIVTRLVEKRFVVVMGIERGHKLCKNGREIPLHKYNGVCHVNATALSELCPLEDPRNDNAPPAEAAGGGRMCHGHEDFHTTPQRTRECHIQSVTYHSELGALTA